MRKLPSMLLAMVAVVHYGYPLIADFYPDMLPAAKAWASVLRAIEATTLYLTVWFLLPRPAGARVAAAKVWSSMLMALKAPTLYLAIRALLPSAPVAAYAVALAGRTVASAACAWGALESAQIAVCRLVYPMDRPPPAVSQFEGLCDKAMGLPLYMITITVVLLVVVLRKP